MSEARSPAFWLPAPGERAIVVGQTGSGKTVVNIHLLRHLTTTPVIIYDTKEEPKFETLPSHRVVFDEAEVDRAVNDQSIDFIVFRPHEMYLADWRALDGLLHRHYTDYRGVDAYIDELSTFHGPSGHNGLGVTSIYSRGRSRGITTIAATQRPAKVSQLALSESQHVFVFHLNKAGDRKKVSDDTGMPEQPNPPKHHFWHYRTDDPQAEPRLIQPVPLPPGYDDAYTDTPPPDPASTPTETLDHLWLGPRTFWTLNRGG